MITVRFVSQCRKGGKGSLGAHSQWRLDQEDRNVEDEARKIREINSSSPYAADFPEFYWHDQTYTHEEEEQKDGNMQRSNHPPMKYLAGYQGSSKKTRIDI